MKNETESKFSILPAALMSFVAFEGVYLLVWATLSLTGYPTSLLGEYKYPAYSIIFRIKTILSPVFLLVIIIAYRKEGLKAFSGLSWSMIVLLVLIYCRICWYSYHFHTYTFVTNLFLLFLPIVAFSIPLSCKSNVAAFRTFLFSCIGLAVLFVVLFYPEVFLAYSIRNYLNTEKYLLLTFSLVGLEFWHPSVLCVYPPFIGAVVALLSYWLWLERKIPIWGFACLYLLGAKLIFFSGSRSVFLSYSVCTTTIFFLSILKKRGMVPILFAGLIIFSINAFYIMMTSQAEDAVVNRLVGTHRLFQRKSTAQSEVKSVPSGNRDAREEVSDSMTSKESDAAVAIESNADQALEKKEENGPMTFAETWNYLWPMVLETSDPEKTKLMTYREEEILVAKTNREARYAMYVSFLISMYKNPWTGTSFGDVLIDFGDGTRRWPLHSILFQPFISLGIFGGLLYIYTLVRSSWNAIFVLFKKPEYGWFSILFFYSLIRYLTSLGWLDIHLWISIVALQACVVSLPKDRESNISIENTI